MVSLLVSDAGGTVLSNCRRLATLDSSILTTSDLQRTLLSEDDSNSLLLVQHAARHNRHAYFTGSCRDIRPRCSL